MTTIVDALEGLDSDSLFALLACVRAETDPPGSTVVPGLDAHIRRTAFDGLETPHTINSKDVIEIQGPSVGKSHLLIHFIMTCLLPITHLGVRLHGWNKSAILIDLDHTFDIHRFRHLLMGRIKAHVPTSGGDLDLLVDLLLGKLHVFRPDSSVRFAVTAANIPNYHSANMPRDEIGLVAIDSLSSFYWQDRFLSEQRRDGRPSGIERALDALEQIRQTHGAVIAYTNWGLPSTRQVSQTSSPFYPQRIPQLHPTSAEEPQASHPILPVTHHITLRTVATPKIPLDIPVAQLMGDRRVYDQVVEALVRTAGFNDQVGSFMFKVTPDEVYFSGRG